MSPAACAIIIRHDKEFLLGVQRLSLISQIHDAVRLFGNDPTIDIGALGLRQVDFIG